MEKTKKFVTDEPINNKMYVIEVSPKEHCKSCESDRRPHSVIIGKRSDEGKLVRFGNIFKSREAYKEISGLKDTIVQNGLNICAFRYSDERSWNEFLFSDSSFVRSCRINHDTERWQLPLGCRAQPQHNKDLGIARP